MSRTGLVALTLLISLSTDAQPAPATEDVTIHSITSFGPYCWAVGDRGVIYRSVDRGDSWALQQTPTNCSLHDVTFISESKGWAVGGQALPYSPGSSGVVLGTLNGGETWDLMSWQQMPRVHTAWFGSSRSGWAAGESSTFFGSGLFRTDAAGTLWRPVTGMSPSSLMDLSFVDKEMGTAVGADGSFVIVRGGRAESVKVPGLGNRTVRAVMVDKSVGELGARAVPGTTWAVGDGGLVLRSETIGASWKVISLGPHVRNIFDWRAVSVRDGAVWIAGRPGSVILHLAQGASKWELQRTGQNLPIHSIHFENNETGYAAGELGTILKTEDGGRSWRIVHSGGNQAAALAVHARQRTMPLLTHVALGAEQGFLTVDLTMSHTEESTAQEPFRSNDALAVAGGAAAEHEWRFHVPDSLASMHQVLGYWNQITERKALAQLERRLVIAIRTWKPEIILGESPEPGVQLTPESALIAQMLKRAVASAADPSAFPELLDQGALQPWRAKKLWFESKEIGTANVRLSAGEMSSRIPGTIGDQTAFAASLLNSQYAPLPETAAYNLLVNHVGENAERSLFAGVSLLPGAGARRILGNPIEITATVERAEQARRNLRALVERTEDNELLSSQLTSQLDVWVNAMTPQQAANSIFHLAQLQYQRGNWRDSRDLYERLIAQYPGHVNSTEAHRWLIQFYGSSELRHRERTSGVMHNNVTSIGQPSGIEPSSETGLTPAERTNTDRLSKLMSDIPWAQGSVDTAAKLSNLAPLARLDPRIQFPLAASQRIVGLEKDADRFYTVFGAGNHIGPWRDVARGERWIRERRGVPPKTTLVSQRGGARPRLDGDLSDPIWQSIKPTKLKSQGAPDSDQWLTSIKITHDRQFIYIALDCATPEGLSAQPLRPRQHDMDLSAQDRIDLFLDLDRDYATYYHLSVDQRGCVAENCWGDPTWNPIWYVASQNHSTGYRLEVAIPLSELTTANPENNDIWLFNAVRHIPGQHIASWSTPAGHMVQPEGFGYLLFLNQIPTARPVAN